MNLKYDRVVSLYDFLLNKVKELPKLTSAIWSCAPASLGTAGVLMRYAIPALVIVAAKQRSLPSGLFFLILKPQAPAAGAMAICILTPPLPVITQLRNTTRQHGARETGSLKGLELNKLFISSRANAIPQR